MDNMAPGMNFPIGNIAGLNELDIESIVITSYSIHYTKLYDSNNG